MAANTVEMKRNDSSPPLSAVLLDKATRLPANLTGCTVVFNMRPSGGGAAKVSRSPAVVTDAAGGAVEYRWTAGDTDTAGTFEAEFEVSAPGNLIRTFPSAGYIEVIIAEDVA